MTLFALIDRNLDKTRLWENPVAVQHYVELAMRAAMSSTDVTVNNTSVHLERGQVAVTQGKLADQWGITTSKLRRELKAMEKDGLISVKSIGRNCSIVSLTCHSNTEGFCESDAQTDAQTDVAFPPSILGSQGVGRRTERRTDRRSNIEDKNIENNILYNKKKINKEEVAKGKLGLYYTDGAPDYEEGLWN